MRILIAGLGAIGQRHARNLRSLLGDRLELLAYRRRRLPHVITESLQRDDTRDVESALGVRAFDDLAAALAERPAAVFICTPSSDHVETAQRAAEAGCHLFIEKPVSHTLDGLETLHATVTAKQLIALVGCQWRYHPAVRWLREVLQTATLGHIARAEIDYGEYLPDWHPYEDYRTSYAARADLGGGVVLTQIHDYDLAWWLFGPPRTVSATGGRLSDLELDVEDTVEAHLDGGDIPIVVRQSLATRPPHRTISVDAEHGSITLDLVAGRISSSPRLIAAGAFAEYQRNEMFLEDARHFCACVEGTEAPAVTLDDGIAVLRVALAVKQSMRERRPVEIS